MAPFLRRISESHPLWPLFRSGWLGVDIFFVISGFVITRSLIEERARTNSISLYDFYVRRTLRIWPLYYVVVAAALTARIVLSRYSAPALNIAFEGCRNGPLLGKSATLVFFLYNYSLARGGQGLGMAFDVCWTLAVEEQFYVLWPQVLKRLTNATCLRLCFFAALVCALLRYYVTQRTQCDGEAVFLPTHLRADSLLAGAAAAFIVNSFETTGARIHATLAELGLTACVLVMGGLYAFYDRTSVAWCTFGSTAAFATTACAFVLAPFCSGSWILAPLQTNVAVALGRISYSLYLTHAFSIFTIATLAEHFDPWVVANLAPSTRDLIVTVGIATLAIASAQLSYLVIERPFLKLKDRLQRRR